MLDRPHHNEAEIQRQEQDKLRRRMERAVERLIAAMDAMDASDDGVEADADWEPSFGSVGGNHEHWASGDIDAASTEREDENEHGGDINDEPCDEPQQDIEPCSDDTDRSCNENHHRQDLEPLTGRTESDPRDRLYGPRIIRTLISEGRYRPAPTEFMCPRVIFLANGDVAPITRARLGLSPIRRKISPRTQRKLGGRNRG